MRKNYKPMIIGILCALIVVMAVGFALLREQLTITGTSHIDSNWNIRITNIRVKSLNSAYATGDNASADVSGSTGCTTNNTPCDSTTANFDAKLVTPGDSITYEVTITNSGNLDGVVESIDLECTDNEAIQCTTSGLSRADTISHTSPNNTNTVEVTVTYNNATESQPVNTNSTIILTINYQQDLGQIQSQNNSGFPAPTPFVNGTGTIYRFATNEWGYVNLNSLREGESIENIMEDEGYGIATSPSDFNSKSNVYLRHDVVNYEVTSSYACFVVNDTEYCLRGGENYHSTNVGILDGMQGFACEDDERGLACSGFNLSGYVDHHYGEVTVATDSGVECSVRVDPSEVHSMCEEN